MLKKSLSIIPLFMLIFLSACNDSQSGGNTVILDLDAIAKATGQADIIKQQIDKANNELTAQLTTISNKLKEQLSAEKEKMSKKLSKDEKKKLEQLTILANQKMQQSRNIANQKSQQYRVALIQNLRRNIQPIAEKIARERNADIVTAVNNSTIWFNPESDITDEVIAKIRAIPLTAVATKQKTTEKQSEEAAK